MYLDGRSIIASVDKAIKGDAALAIVNISEIRSGKLKKFSDKYINSGTTKEETLYYEAILVLLQNADKYTYISVFESNSNDPAKVNSIKDVKEEYESNKKAILSDDIKKIEEIVNSNK